MINISDTTLTSKQIVSNIWNPTTMKYFVPIKKKSWLVITEIIRFQVHSSHTHSGEPKTRHAAPRQPSERR